LHNKTQEYGLDLQGADIELLRQFAPNRPCQIKWRY